MSRYFYFPGPTPTHRQQQSKSNRSPFPDPKRALRTARQGQHRRTVPLSRSLRVPHEMAGARADGNGLGSEDDNGSDLSRVEQLLTRQ
jgi:hypothetical protein